MATNGEWITYLILCYTCVNCLYCSTLKEPKTYHGSTIACVVLAIASILFFVLAGIFKAQAQYNTDSWLKVCPQYTEEDSYTYFWLCPSGIYTRGAYNEILLTVGDNATSVVIQIEDSDLVYCHAPEATDLWQTVTIWDEDMTVCYYDVSTVCSPVNPVTYWYGGDPYNDAYTLTIDLPAGVYRVYFYVGTSNSSPFCGGSCLTIGVNGVLGLGIENFDPVRNQMNRRHFDILGRIYD